ncbi:MAG: hypothetical protein HZA90_21015 [Verrucomicrobia bacterium]|nr:hypothetical protein [Verrucomicrobiota bacterium]
MNPSLRTVRLCSAFAVWASVSVSTAAVFNLKVVTDASPDYSDLPSMIRSITGQWETPEQKCWAMFYWNHIARRQTQPMELHGLALTDPIRQFNDYGYTMCSTISGINCAIWDAMGLRAKYWDISLHTVPEVEYDGRWHMYDNSMSALYTLCDGKTLAGVADIGKPGACAASGGLEEPGHVARYHCLMATSPRGFLTGADTIRSLEEEYRCFNPNGLKYRSYFYDWDRGHRYVLNLRDHESYTRHYRSLGKTPEFYIPNRGKDPEKLNERYHLRGNGVWSFQPALTAEALASSAHWLSNVTSSAGGVAPARAGEPGEIVFKVDGANVITSLKIRGRVLRKTAADLAQIAVSTVNGRAWKTVWQHEQTGETPLDLQLLNEVSGAYEVLVKVSLLGKASAGDAQLRSLEFETLTQLNSKTQPRLLLGKNTVYVGAGAQTESIVFWPDLQGTNAQPFIVEQKNLTSATKHPGYLGVMSVERPNEEAHVVFRLDAPRELTRVEYGGRLYNRAPRSRIDFLHSFDGGKTWTQSYSLTNTAPPWDVIHYETVESVPPGTRSVLFQYRLQSSAAGKDACSLYAVRMEANHRPAAAAFKPLEVTFNWSERQADYSLVERSHTEVFTKLPHRYVVNVGGADHPVANSLRVGTRDTTAPAKPGYSDGRDVGGAKFVPRWVTYGKNLARGKPYAVSVPSNTQWGAGDPNGKKLTDGVAGPPYPGGTAPGFAACWNKGQNPDITVDLGRAEKCGAFRIQVGAGWPWWDALKGQIKDQVELLTSFDGEKFGSQGFFNFNLRWRDFPANHFWPDDETLCAHLFELILPAPVDARYVRFKLTPARIVTVSEVEVLESIDYAPFDLRLALPDKPLTRQ